MLDSNIMGLDLGLGCTGIASACSGVIRTRALKTTKKGHERTAYLLDSIQLAAQGHDLVGIEGLAYAAKGRSILDIAGFHFQVRQRLWENYIPYVVIAPAIRMKYVTGKGGGPAAKKDLVWAAALRRWPETVMNTHDEADAVILAAIAARVYRDPFDGMIDIDHFSPVNSMTIVRRTQ